MIIELQGFDVMEEVLRRDYEESVIMADGRLKIERIDKVMVITITRPEVLNALDVETVLGLRDIFTGLSDNLSVEVVVLAGEGSLFVSGGDLVQFSKLKGQVGGRALSELVGEVLGSLSRLSQISIAAIGGDAYGGGVELALACDLRVVEASAKLSLSQPRFGLTTGWGGGVRLSRLVGYSRALELLLTQRQVGGVEAERMGLVNEVVDDGRSLPRALELGAKVSAIGREVSEGIKSVLWAAEEESFDEAVLKEREIFSRLWGGERHDEKVQAFLERSSRTSSG